METNDIKSLNKLAYSILSKANVTKLPVMANQILEAYKIEAKTYSEIKDDNIKNAIDFNKNTNLINSGGNTVLFYNNKIIHKDYLIIKSIALFLLDDNKKFEGLAEILTLLIMTPPVVLTRIGVFDVEEISELCNVPPHKIHQYYDFYKDVYPDPGIKTLKLFKPFIRQCKKQLKYSVILKTFAGIIKNHAYKKLQNETEQKYINMREKCEVVYVKRKDKIYHSHICESIIDEIDVDISNLYEEKKHKHKPCPICFDLSKK